MQEAEGSFGSQAERPAFLALPVGPLLALLRSPDLAVNGEMEVWHAVAAWVQHSPAQRSCHLLQLLGAP